MISDLSEGLRQVGVAKNERKRLHNIEIEKTKCLGDKRVKDTKRLEIHERYLTEKKRLDVEERRLALEKQKLSLQMGQMRPSLFGNGAVVN